MVRADRQISRTVLLLSESADSRSSIDFDRIGVVVTELSHLYQVVKERRIDLILADEDRTDLVPAVAGRIRRHHGLTDIWRLGTGDPPELDVPEFMDGTVSIDLGEKGLVAKRDAILGTKDLLAGFGLVARSSRMRDVATTIDRFAGTDVSVLIVGGSGTGKELVARAVHLNSTRADRPYVAVNCGALAEGVLESELFGHEKGAFTGSVSKREGLFAKADGGTIFLDEIGETKPETQVRLLRVLEDGTFFPVGSSTARQVDVRLISATNRDLAEAIADRQFREDLYFRIGVVRIVLPPLLDRLEDIRPLLQHFWSDTKDLDIADSALGLLKQYDWPGNVRQLKNFADRMRAFRKTGLVQLDDVERFLEEQNAQATHLPVSTGRTVEEAGQELMYRAIMQLGSEVKMLRELIVAHLPAQEPVAATSGETVEDLPAGTVEEMERRLMAQVLDDVGGNRREAARKLGMAERTLYRKIKKYRLE
jgi:DNA-binding NtrC family response regulator